MLSSETAKDRDAKRRMTQKAESVLQKESKRKKKRKKNFLNQKTGIL